MWASPKAAADPGLPASAGSWEQKKACHNSAPFAENRNDTKPLQTSVLLQ